MPDAQKQIFPDWLRRLDPLLEAEDTNTLFQLFYPRHSIRSIFLLHGFQLYQTFLPIHTLFLFIFLLVIFNPLCALIIFIMILWIVQKLLQTKPLLPAPRIMSPTISRTLCQILKPNRAQFPIVLDLWQSGIKGNEILEAMYLELRARTWKLFFVFMVLSVICGTSILIYFSLQIEEVLSPLIVIIIVSSCYIFFHSKFFQGPSIATKNHIAKIFLSWCSDHPVLQTNYPSIPFESIRRGCLSTPMIYFFIYLPTSFMFTLIVRQFSAFLGFQVIFLMVFMIFIYPLRQERALSAIRQMLSSDADLAFDHFVRARVLEDPDA